MLIQFLLYVTFLGRPSPEGSQRNRESKYEAIRLLRATGQERTKENLREGIGWTGRVNSKENPIRFKTYQYPFNK